MDRLLKIIDKIAANIDKYPQDLVAAATDSEDLLTQLFEVLIESMDYSGGTLAATQRNFQLINQVDAIVSSLFQQSPYITGLSSYATGMGVQLSLVQEYFQAATELTDVTKYQTAIRSIQARAIDGLTEQAINNSFAKPLKDILNQSITTGVTRKEVNTSLTNYIKGTPELDGKLTKYVKQISNDAFASVDRQVTKLISEDLGMEWWLYAGGTVKDSRKFCIERHGHYFHTREIESWVNLTWQGKAPVNEGTIFALVGGYNCQHILMPVTIDFVPKEDLDRNINNGNYTPK